MQTIESTSRLEKADIPILGNKLFLAQVTKFGNDAPNADVPKVLSFSDGVILPCVVPCYTETNDNDNHVHVFRSLESIGKQIFGMDNDSARKMSNYLKTVADQLQLELIPATNGIMMVSHILQEMAAKGKTWGDVLEESANNNNRDLMVATGSMGFATLYAKAVEYGTDWFNRVNYKDKVLQVAEIIKSCQIIGDSGEQQSLSLTNVDDFLTSVKDIIRLR